MNAKEISDCSFNGIPVPAFVLGVLVLEGWIWVVQQMLIAHAQIHQGDTANGAEYHDLGRRT